MEKQTLKIAGASYVSPRAKVVALKARSVLCGSPEFPSCTPGNSGIFDDDEEEY